MARTLDQIIAELTPTYQPQVESLQTQMGQIPGQIQAQESALGAQKDQAYQDIIDQSRRRGVGFSGIPLGEQGKYAATTYAPALANLRTAGTQQATSLQDAINSIYEKRNTMAQQLRESDLNRDYTAEQNALNRQTTAANTISPSLNYTQPTTPTQTSTVDMSKGKAVRNKAGDYAFYDVNNAPITAAKYATSTGQNLGDILYEMASDGDKTSQRIYTAIQNGGGTGNFQLMQALKKAFPWVLGD